MTYWIHPEWLRHDVRDVACFVALCSLLANFMPKTAWVDRKLQRWPLIAGPVHDFYLWLVDMIAFCGLNWRVELPSMEFQWFGFARAAKHAVRNLRQDQIDRRTQ